MVGDSSQGKITGKPKWPGDVDIPQSRKPLIKNPVPHPLAGARLKASRAMEHLITLDHEIAAYCDRKPYTIVRELDPNDKRVRVSFWLTEFPPDHLSVVIGDCVSNLRSSLDHLTWQLVIANGGTPDRQTAFPIFKDRVAYQAKMGSSGIAGGVAKKAMAVIETLQPYHRRNDPEGHPLWILNELRRVDTHRTLHTTTMQSIDTEVALILSTGRRLVTQVATGIVQHSAVIALFPLTEGDIRDVDEEMEVEARGKTFISLDEPGRWAEHPVVVLLERLVDYVGQVILPRFNPFVR